jgi:hypothetical protein
LADAKRAYMRRVTTLIPFAGTEECARGGRDETGGHETEKMQQGQRVNHDPVLSIAASA